MILFHTQPSLPFLPGPPTFSRLRARCPRLPQLPSPSLAPQPFSSALRSRPQLPGVLSPPTLRPAAKRPNPLLTCIAAARRAQPLPFPVSRTACCAHQSENSKRDHPNDFRFLPGTELAGSEVRSGATSLARAGAGGQCDGLGAPGARGEGCAGAGPRPEGRRLAAFTLRSLEEAIAVLFTQMPS